MTHRRAIIYCRVSQDSTGQARSVTSQESECRAMCEREGWDVAEVLTDNDLGASRWSGVARPEYERLQDILRPGDVLVTWEASRAQRDLAAYVALRDLCHERGVLWAYSGRTYDLARGDDRFGTGLDALIAEREADQIRERVLRGKRAAALTGRPSGALPFGYRRTLEGWEIDENAAPVVQEITRRVIAGEPIRAISRDLNRRGAPTPDKDPENPKPWDNTRIRAMFRSPSIAGVRIHRGEIIGQASWPAIITEAEWHQVRAIFDDPTRSTTTGRAPRHLLSGIARCGVCGEPLRYRKPSRQRPGYACANYHVGRRADLVDEVVVGVIVGRLGMDDARDVFSRPDDSHTRAVDELRALRSRLEAFADSAADGEITPAAFARIEARLLPQIADAEKRTNAGTAGPVVELVAAEDVQAAWDALPIDSQRMAVRLLIDVTVNKSTAGTRRFNPDDIEIRWKSG